MQLKPLKPQYVGKLLRFEKELFGNLAWTREQFQQIRALSGLSFYFLDPGPPLDPQGYAVLHKKPELTILSRFGVGLVHQRTGVGRKLFSELLQHIPVDTPLVTRVREHQSAAIMFLKSVGFELWLFQPNRYQSPRVAAGMVLGHSAFPQPEAEMVAYL